MLHSLHVFYYDDNKEALLLDGIQPALQEIVNQGLSQRVSIRRHWLYGPHVRLHIDAEPELFHSTIAPLVKSRVDSYLQRSPSHRPLDAEAYGRLSEELGSMELVPGPYLPLCPDNTVQEFPFDPRVEVYGSEQLSELASAYLADTHEMLFRLMAETRGAPAKRLTRVFAFMTLLGCLYPGGIERGHLSFRSHSEGFLFGSPPAVRTKFEQTARENEERLGKILAQVVDACREGVYQGPDPLLRDWTLLHAERYRMYCGLVAEGVIPRNRDALDQAASRMDRVAPGPWNQAGWAMSPFHQKFMRPDNPVLTSDAFVAYRWLINSFYLLLPTLGISSFEKFLLCFLVAEAAERVLGVSWQGLHWR